MRGFRLAMPGSVLGLTLLVLILGTMPILAERLRPTATVILANLSFPVRACGCRSDRQLRGLVGRRDCTAGYPDPFDDFLNAGSCRDVHWRSARDRTLGPATNVASLWSNLATTPLIRLTTTILAYLVADRGARQLGISATRHSYKNAPSTKTTRNKPVTNAVPKFLMDVSI